MKIRVRGMLLSLCILLTAVLAGCGRAADSHTAQNAEETKAWPASAEALLPQDASVLYGADHNAAVTADGVLYMWGSNRQGQLGDGTTTDSTVPIRVMEHVRAVALGTCVSTAITEDGRCYMWGRSDDAYRFQSLIPQEVALP